MHSDVVTLKVNAMYLPDMLCSMILIFCIGNMSKMLTNIPFSYTSEISPYRFHLNSDFKYNYENCQLFYLLVISRPCLLDSDGWLKSPAWGNCYIFAIFDAFLHQWWLHTLCGVQEAFSGVAVRLFPLKSLEILLSSLSQAKVNSFENPILLVYTGKKKCGLQR